MKKLILILIVVIFSAGLFYSCNEAPANTDAVRMKLEDIEIDPGFTWFSLTYNDYIVEADVMTQIRNKYDPQAHKIIVFAKPSCSCEGDHKYFPRFMKILDSAGIDENHYEIYSTREITNKHPYMSVYKLNHLPEFVVMKNGLPVYSILDSLNYYAAQGINYPKYLEEFLFEAMKK